MPRKARATNLRCGVPPTGGGARAGRPAGPGGGGRAGSGRGDGVPVEGPMTNRRPELVSKATRRGAAQSCHPTCTSRPSSSRGRDQEFVPASELHYEDSSVRRTTFESYAAGVDWTDVAQVERALRAFESQLRWLPTRTGTGPATSTRSVSCWTMTASSSMSTAESHWRRPLALEVVWGGHSSVVMMSCSCSALAVLQPAGWRTAAQPSANSRV
jgi:hypothetical protein